MTSPRHAPRDGATRTSPGHEPRRSDAVVRQRLRAVAGGARPAAVRPSTGAVTAGGRPVLDWQPATGAFVAVPGPTAGVALPGHDPGVPEAQRSGGELSDADPSGPGWLPERPVMPRADRRDPMGLNGDARPDDGVDVTPVAVEDDLALRARRRAATTVAQAYAAAHGHPTQHSGFEGLDEADDPDRSRPRVAVRSRVAVAAAVLVLAVAGVTSFVTLRPEPVVALGTAETTSADGGTEAEGDASEAVSGGAKADDGAGPDDGSGERAGGGTGAGATDGAPGTAATVVVHVVGQVAAPGLVTVVDGARVADALAAAGGTLPEADVAALNIARTVVDGEQIVVPRPGEAVAVAGPGPATGAGGGPGGSASAAAGPVDLNAADAAALDALPGIGPVLAERIVAWRTEHGRFASVDELGEVNGIGPAILADLRDLVRV